MAELVRSVGEGTLFAEPVREELRKAELPLRRLARISDATLSDIAQAREAAADAERAIATVSELFSLTVAARTGKLQLPDIILSVEELFDLDTGQAVEIANRIQTLHFPISFPEVFLRRHPGFDVFVGNPPWDTLKAEPHKYWSLRFPRLRSLLPGEMNRQMDMLRKARPDIVAEYSDYKMSMDTQREALLKGPYPGLGSGDPDLSEFFAWRFWQLLRPNGRMAVVLPRSILMSAGTDEWRADLFQNGKVEEILMGCTWVARIFTKANSAATNRPLRVTRNSARTTMRPSSARLLKTLPSGEEQPFRAPKGAAWAQ